MSTTLGEPDYEQASQHALITGIKQVLGITSKADAKGNVRESQMLKTLELLSFEKLRLVLAVSVQARELSVLEPSTDHQHHHIYYPRDTEHPFTGEDCYTMRDLLYKGALQNVYVLATSLDLIPANMTIREALGVIGQVRDEMFELNTRELIGAHLKFGHSLFKQQRYTPQLMLLVQTHPDKTEAIITEYQRTQSVPSHRTVITSHAAAEGR